MGTGKTGIIFDLDGTLWDACEVMSEAWNTYIRQHEPALAARGIRSTEEIMRRNCGRTIREFADLLLGTVPERDRYAISDACWDYVVRYIGERGGKPYPFFRETLEALRARHSLYIVSNGQAGYCRDFTRVTGTRELFEDTEEYGTTGLGKAENIRLVMKRCGVERAVYVGDTVMDFESAREAGIPFIHAAYGFGQVPEPDARITQLRELVEAVPPFFRD